MHSDDPPPVTVRPMEHADRPIVSRLIVSIENFSQQERECALELVDTYLNERDQGGYRIVVAEDAASGVQGYACWGPVPLTRGTYDLYWIATHPQARRRGFGRALMEYVEKRVRAQQGRILAIETSSKDSYGNTVAFYRRLGYEEISRIGDFYDVGDDKLIFVKRLT